MLLGPGGAVDINEICVCKSSRLPSATINGHTNINDVSYFAEEVIEILIGHLEGHVADEEGLGGLIRAPWLYQVWWWSPPVVLDGHSASLEDCLVHGCDSGIGVRLTLEFNITEPGTMLVSNCALI